MQDVGNYCTLQELVGIQDRVLGKQLQSFEQLLARLLSITCVLGRFVLLSGEAATGQRELCGQGFDTA